jgi:hypothetical protein
LTPDLSIPPAAWRQEYLLVAADFVETRRNGERRTANLIERKKKFKIEKFFEIGLK